MNLKENSGVDFFYIHHLYFWKKEKKKHLKLKIMPEVVLHAYSLAIGK